MARSYYSTVFDCSADEVWQVIRDFGHYTWAAGVDEVRIEDGRPGDAVGAVRAIRVGSTAFRQQLLAHSDLDRSFTYSFCEPSRYPSVSDYRATLRVTPVVDGGRAFLEWWATFDCPAGDLARWTAQFADSFGTWLGSLRATMAARPRATVR